jgi:Flp pilus assembly protein TadD
MGTRGNATGTRVTLHELKQAVASRPQDAAACHALGWAYAGRREEDDAVEWLERAACLDPSCSEHFLSLGKVLARQVKIERAIEACRAALMVSPDNVEAAMTLGQLCERLGQHDEAAEAYAGAIAHAPREADAYEGLHAAMVAERTPDEAAARAATRAPAAAQPLMMRIGLALGLAQHGRYPEAVAHWRTILRDAPDDPVVLSGAAESLAMLGHFDECEQLLARALALYPTNDALILAQLDLYSRTGRVDAIRARAREPHVLEVFVRIVGTRADVAWWDGERQLEGKTVLIEARGGYGDSLHYGRVLPLLKARGAHIVVQGYPQLSALLQALPGADEFVAPFEPCRPYDYYARLKYVPFLLDWSWDWIAKTVPYVSVDPALARTWRARFAPDRLNIGIVWRSRAVDAKNPYTYRSAPIDAFEPLARVPNVTVYGLQVGPGAADVTPETGRWLTANFADETREFAQAAAAIQALDATVSVDTSIAHLAGALGRPGFFLLPRSPDSRWMSEALTADRRCLWYPSARLYPQERPGDWGSAMQHVAEALTQMAAAHH